jgi:hypothetical protein
MVKARKLFKAGPLAQQYQAGLSLAQNFAKLTAGTRHAKTSLVVNRVQGVLALLLGSSCAPSILVLRL